MMTIRREKMIRNAEEIFSDIFQNIKRLCEIFCHEMAQVLRSRIWLNSLQRWANSVLMTEYEYEYYSTFKKWPNTNTNIIRFEKGDRIQIRILFALKIAAEYEYEYYSVWKNRPNTNTNFVWFENIEEYKYEYYSV